jgi:tryptophanase
MNIVLPPYRIKTVQKIKQTSRAERIKKLEAAHFNPFFLDAGDVCIDLLTDSGTGAMSDEQWSAILQADESYAGSISFKRMERAIQDVLGFQYIIPTHQGRGAEDVFDRLMIKEGMLVPGNKHFDTTKAHIEDKKGTAVDCTIDEIHNTQSDFPFKGNLDLDKLENVIVASPDKIAYALITITCNSGGGQPVSMGNICAVANICEKYGVPLFFDAARFAENAYFIKEREEGYANATIQEIVHEMMSRVDGCLMSAKKDAIVNIGGFIAVRSQKLYENLAPIAILKEGFLHYGGMSGRDMEALAVGIREGVDYNYLRYRTWQVRFLAEELQKIGVPVVTPPGGHAVYIDAKKFLPHIPREQFPGHALVCQLYIEGGIRSVEIGSLLAGRDPKTGVDVDPGLELLRLTLPRRVYLLEHLYYIVEVFKNLAKIKNQIRGVEFVYEPPTLRHFNAKFKLV